MMTRTNFFNPLNERSHIDLDNFCLVFHKHPFTMEISVREMLKDVFPRNRRKLALGIVDHVKETRLTAMSFCAADKIAKSIMRLIKVKKFTKMSLFGKNASGKMILDKVFKILPVADAPDVREVGDLPVVVPDGSVRIAELKARIEATKERMSADQIMLVEDESELRALQPDENRSTNYYKHCKKYFFCSIS